MVEVNQHREPAGGGYIWIAGYKESPDISVINLQVARFFFHSGVGDKIELILLPIGNINCLIGQFLFLLHPLPVFNWF